jgi:peptidoglycan hydrolase-like protein with peptidoglycan-binding domain
LAQLRAALTAARAKEAVDCQGTNAAASPLAAGGSGGGGSGSTLCASGAQTVATDEQSETQAAAKVAADQSQVSSAGRGLAAARSALADDHSSGSVYGQSSSYTALPAVGKIVSRGQSLYSISGQPVVLLYGPVAAWRAFLPGMSAGRDVAELNANLDALGYGLRLSGDSFTSTTSAAIDAFQSEHGLTQTGQLLLGSVVFEPGAVRVTAVTPTIGATVQPGPVLSVTSTRRQVTIALDAAQQSQLEVGDPVVITLPDNSTTPGRVSYVGTVATTPSSDQGGGGGGSGTPTIAVDVTPTDPAATGHLDQAPVNVSITTASITRALVVPVNALLALANGGYALEEIGSGGAHQLVAVDLGLFDDQDGLVQVTGSGLAAGQRVVVPSE